MSVQEAQSLYKRGEASQEWLRNILGRKSFQVDVWNGWYRQRLQLIEDIEEFLGMAKKKDRTKATWKAFANVDIPDSRMNEAAAIIKDADKTVDRISELVGLGYKLSVSYNASNDTFTATLTGAYADLPNAGMSLSGYAKDWVMALGAVCYKHFEMCDGKWTEKTQDTTQLFG